MDSKKKNTNQKVFKLEFIFIIISLSMITIATFILMTYPIKQKAKEKELVAKFLKIDENIDVLDKKLEQMTNEQKVLAEFKTNISSIQSGLDSLSQKQSNDIASLDSRLQSFRSIEFQDLKIQTENMRRYADEKVVLMQNELATLKTDFEKLKEDQKLAEERNVKIFKELANAPHFIKNDGKKTTENKKPDEKQSGIVILNVKDKTGKEFYRNNPIPTEPIQKNETFGSQIK